MCNGSTNMIYGLLYESKINLNQHSYRTAAVTHNNPKCYF